MMTKEQLQERISKKEKDIQKIYKRIDKWTKGMNEEAKSIVAACEEPIDSINGKEISERYRTYKEAHYNDSTVFNQEDWNKGPQLNEAYCAYRDLSEAKATLNKYQTQLDKLINYDKEEKIEVLVEFLKNWKQKAYEFYCENADLYFNLKLQESEQYNIWKNSDEIKEYMLDRNGKINYHYTHKWKEEYYSEVHKLSREIIRMKYHYVHHDENHFDYDYVPYEYTINTDTLNKVLDEEVRNKYKDLVERITKVTGVIQDCSNLKIGKNGSINGYVIGDKASAKVETISAGGYHIQCFHYRVLVNKIN